jgi:hypothetical protein
MPSKMQHTPPSNDEKSSNHVSHQEQKKDAPVVYPSNQKRILIMISLYLAIFLVTLVRLLSCKIKFKIITALLIAGIGPKYYINCNPSNNRRISLYQ